MRLWAAALLLGTVVACDGEPDAGLDRLVIATGESGDVYFALGQALAGAAADRLSVDARVLPTTGSVDNLRAVAEGRADAGFATVDTVNLAAQGDAPFTGALPVVALARLYDDHLQIAIRADSRIEQVSDLQGLPVSTGAAGSGTDVVAERVLEAAGHELHDLDQRQLSPAQAGEELLAGGIDAFFVTGGLPMPALEEVAARRPIRLLSLLDEIDELQSRFGEHYQSRTIPARTYPGMAEEVETLGIANVLVVRRDMPAGTAYRLTELLFEAKDKLVTAHPEARRLDHRSALATYPVVLHPGAVQYYRDNKVLAVVRPGAGLGPGAGLRPVGG